MPLGLAQAAAVIATQHLNYDTYLGRLRALPVAECLAREPGQPYPNGVAEAVLLSLEAVQADDRGGVCAGVLELMCVLSAAGVRRDLLHGAGQAGALGAGPAVDGAGVDGALGRLAERSLVTFSLHGQAIIAHRLVLRVVRDGLAKEGRLGGGAPGCSLRANGARGGAFGVAGPCGRAGRSRAGDGSAGAYGRIRLCGR